MTWATRHLARGVTIFAVAALTASRAAAIVGGAETPPRAYPFVVALINHITPPDREGEG